MNEFDHFIKHKLKVKKYVRYTDDFIIIDENPHYLRTLLLPIRLFLNNKLRLDLHPKKVTLRKYLRGIDFLGYVALPHHRVLRTKTRRRMFRRLKDRVRAYKRGEVHEVSLFASLCSYLGILSHANAYQLTKVMKNRFWFWLKE